MTAGIAVVMCAWNAERFIAQALDSIAGQSLAPAEVIIVDDGSTDATAAIAEAHSARPRVIRCEHAGLGASRIVVLGEVTADRFTFLDADDLLPPGSLEVRNAWMDANPGVDGVFGACIQFREGDGAEEPPSAARLAATLLASRNVLGRGVLFDASLRVGEFIDWYTRVTQAGATFGTIDDVVLRRRNHDQNMGHAAVADGTNSDYLRIVREHLRRKAAGG